MLGEEIQHCTINVFKHLLYHHHPVCLHACSSVCAYSKLKAKIFFIFSRPKHYLFMQMYLVFIVSASVEVQSFWVMWQTRTAWAVNFLCKVTFPGCVQMRHTQQLCHKLKDSGQDLQENWQALVAEFLSNTLSFRIVVESHGDTCDNLSHTIGPRKPPDEDPVLQPWCGLHHRHVWACVIVCSSWIYRNRVVRNVRTSSSPLTRQSELNLQLFWIPSL